MSTSMERTFDTPHPVELAVENARGLVEVTATDTDQSSVSITGESAEEFTVELDGDRLTVLSPRRAGIFLPHNNKAHVVVQVPATSSMHARAASSDLRTRGPLGDTTVGTGSGDVEIDRIDGTTEIRSGSGDVTVRVLGGSTRIKSGSGDVRIDGAESDLVVTSGSGDVVVGAARGPLAVKTGSGNVEVAGLEQDLTFATGSGDLRVGRARRGRISIKAASGDVDLGIAEATPVWTDIKTLSGRLRSDLPATGEPTEGQDFVEVRAQTVSGDVVLRRS